MSTYTIAVPPFDASDPSDWYLETTVDAHMGYHTTGMVMREYRAIRTAASDYGDPDDLTAGDVNAATWWAETLTPIHAAAVLTAEASPEEIVSAMTALGCADAEAWDRYAESLDLEEAATLSNEKAEALLAAKG